MAEKSEMLARMRAALGREGSTAAPKPLPAFSSCATAATGEDIVNQFCVELEKVSGRVTRINSTAEIKSYLERLLPKSAPATVAVSDADSLRDAGLREWLAGRGASVLPSLKEFGSSDAGTLSQPGDNERAENDNAENDSAALMERYKRALMKADIGVTSADCAIADTGTLVLVSGGEQHRLISLVPPVHVCLLDQARIVANLSELMNLVCRDFYSSDVPPLATTFITGPSRTADIELSLTLGVHGPRELHVLLKGISEKACFKP